jgi:hypothetical protein
MEKKNAGSSVLSVGSATDLMFSYRVFHGNAGSDHLPVFAKWRDESFKKGELSFLSIPEHPALRCYVAGVSCVIG